MPAQLAGWLLMACVWYSAHGYYRLDSDPIGSLLAWNTVMYVECVALTHFFLRPLYWWLSRTDWRSLPKIIIYISAIHLCVWILLGVDEILFRFVSLSTNKFEWSELNAALLYHVVMVTWALAYIYWTAKENRREAVPKENIVYYVICQMLGWSMVCGFWYVLYTGRGKDVAIEMGFFVPWVLMVYASGILLSHLLLRPFSRRLINLEAGPITKILLCITVAYICMVWRSLISLVWVVWSNVQLVERTPQENIASAVTFFAIFCIWLLLYLSWLNWQQKNNETTRRLKLEANYQVAKMSGLKQQLNPHFIFNALNSLRAMIIKDQYVARKMVTEISNLLRYTLYESEQDVVSLEKEIDVVKNYLAIEQLRYEGRISIEWDIPDELLPTKVIPLCIQTLVENAIKHTINQYPDGIFIHIRAEENGPNIHISVSNRGKITPSGNDGIGLKNTKERLGLIFGDGSTLALTQKEDELVEAILIIPKTYNVNPSVSESNI